MAPPLDDSQKSELIQQTREKFLALVEKNPDQYDSADVEWMKKTDWNVERFMIRRKYNVEQSVKMIEETMKWRNELGIPRLTDLDFPEEFFKVGAIFDYEPDRDNTGVIYWRVRKHRRLAGLDDLKLKFLLYMMNKIDRVTNGNGYVIVYDCKGATLGNLDLTQSYYMASIMRKYCPEGMKYILVYELPWILVQSWKLIQAMVPSEFSSKIKMINQREIFDYIDPANVPRDMTGGECERNYRNGTGGCRNMETICQELKLSEQNTKNAMKVYQKLIEETDKECNIKQVDSNLID